MQETTSVVFYAHARLGLGHLKRSLSIAEQLAARHQAVCTLVGCRRGIEGLSIPDGIEAVPLPDWPSEATRDGAAICRRRRAHIDAVMNRCTPDAVVVDHLFTGLGGELGPLLRAPPNPERPARFIIGLPYGPPPSARGPRNRSVRQLMARYDAALCYVDPQQERPADRFAAQGFPLPNLCHHVGYVVESLATLGAPARPPLIVGLAGGGTTGAGLFEVLIAALRPDLARGRVRLRIVAGPLAARAATGDTAAGAEGLEVWPEAPLGEALRDASAVVSRCGYNTASALMGTRLPVVFCPFDGPNSDQIERSARLGCLDGVWTTHERDGAAAMRARIAEALAAAGGVRARAIDCGGAAAAAERILEITRATAGPSAPEP